MNTIKLFSSDGRALTKITSDDYTISLPHEIQIADDGKATACHADSGDQHFADLDALCSAYRIDADAVRAAA